MRVLVVQESMFGNTAAVARAIADALQDRAEVTLVDAQHAPADPGPDLDLLVLGAPTHAFSLPRDTSRADAVGQGAPADRIAAGIREWIAALPPARTPVVATFCTKMHGRWTGSAARAAARLARRRGLRVAATEDFLVEGTTG